MSEQAALDVHVVVLDVNETLSDLAPLRRRFVDVGAEASLAATWFASVLRDGMALAAVGQAAGFADIGRSLLDTMLPDPVTTATREAAADHVLQGFMTLSVHPDVAEGLRALRDLGLRVVTLSNGSSAVAEGLLERAGLDGVVEATLSVDDAGVWKPARRAYEHAAAHTGEPLERHLLVAVHPWDVHGARHAGLGAAWIDRTAGAAYPGHFAAPDLTATSLIDLAEQLGRHRREPGPGA